MADVQTKSRIMSGPRASAPPRRPALVVEPHPDHRRTLLRALGQLDVTPVGFATAEEALDWLELARVPALITVDLALSVAGVSLCRLLRDHPRLVNVPVIGLIDESGEGSADNSPACEADVVLSRPVRLADFLGAASPLLVPWRSPVGALLNA